MKLLNLLIFIMKILKMKKNKKIKLKNALSYIKQLEKQAANQQICDCTEPYKIKVNFEGKNLVEIHTQDARTSVMFVKNSKGFLLENSEINIKAKKIN